MCVCVCVCVQGNGGTLMMPAVMVVVRLCLSVVMLYCRKQGGNNTDR